SCFERVANLPLDIHRDTNPARAGQRFNSRGDVYSVAIDITVAMDNVADVNADLEFDPPVERDVVVALGQGALDFDAALRRLQRAAEFHKEGITDGFDFRAVKARKDLPQQMAMFFEQLEGEPVVALRQCAVTHHVGEHDGGQFALFDVFGRHERIKPERVRKEIANLPRSVYLLHLSVDLQLRGNS